VRISLSFSFHSTSFTDLNYRPIKKLRRLAHITPPAVVKESVVPKVEAHCQPTPLKRADGISHPLASETVEDLREMIEALDVKHPFKTNRKTSFPRKDYTPYVTYADCRDNGGPSRRPGSPSSSNDGDAQ